MTRPQNSIDVAALMAELRHIGVAELRERYEALTSERCNSGNRDWLTKRIVWLEQARVEGGLPERARRRALEIADDKDLRFRPPTMVVRDVERCDAAVLPDRDPRLPMPGSELRRVYKGIEIAVRVLPDGLEYAGRRYRSLTSIATEVTRSNWTGFHFIGLNGKNNRGDHGQA